MGLGVGEGVVGGRGGVGKEEEEKRCWECQLFAVTYDLGTRSRKT